jgi:hypothetical protein
VSGISPTELNALIDVAQSAGLEESMHTAISTHLASPDLFQLAAERIERMGPADAELLVSQLAAAPRTEVLYQNAIIDILLSPKSTLTTEQRAI